MSRSVSTKSSLSDFISFLQENCSGFRRPRSQSLSRRELRGTPEPLTPFTGIGCQDTEQNGINMQDAGSKGRVLDKIAAFVGLMDQDGTLLEANQAALEVAGLSARDVIGKKLWDCYWWSYSPESRERLIRAHRTALQGEDVRHEVQIRVAEDRLIWIDFQLAALRDETGRVSQLVPSGIELTARREAEDNLKR